MEEVTGFPRACSWLPTLPLLTLRDKSGRRKDLRSTLLHPKSPQGSSQASGHPCVMERRNLRVHRPGDSMSASPPAGLCDLEPWFPFL